MEEVRLQDTQTEESVLAHIIGIPERYNDVQQILSDDSFGNDTCRTVWKVIVWSVNRGKTPDLLYLQGVYRENNRSDIKELERIAAAPVSPNLEQQVERLEEYRKRRAYHDLRVELMKNEDAGSEDLASILGKYREKIEKNTTSKVMDKIALMNHAATLINDNLDPNKRHLEIMTGFRVIDRMGGLPPGTETIIAAFSSQGKTSFALSIIDYAMRYGCNTAVYSLEMGKSSIAGRLLNMMGWGVPIIKLKTQPLLDNTIAEFNQLSGEFIGRPGELFVDDSSNLSVDNICASIRVLHRKHGLHLVMVDYLQIVALYEETADSDQEKLARASRKLQALAQELNICIMVLSQFSRPLRGMGHQPTEDLIRGSGQIFEATDIAIYIYRPWKWKEQYPAPFADAETDGTAMIKIGKYRDGESDVASIVKFDGARMTFYDFPEGMYDVDPEKNYPKATVSPQMNPENPF